MQQPTDELPRQRLPCQRIVELCRWMYERGWASGTGGGLSIREGSRAWIAPSGVQKERLHADDLFEVALGRDASDYKVTASPQDESLRISACTPLFLSAYHLRDAACVLHSHSINAMLATLLFEREFQCTELEMMKGIRGTGYHDTLVVPIIDNTAHECDLAETLQEAIRAYPKAYGVLVRRHGVYIWGDSWQQAKVHAECYDYLFQAVVQMHQLNKG